MDAYYSFILDLFPLTEELWEQHSPLGARIASVALERATAIGP